MPWKVERWLEEVFPGKDKIYSEYRLLPRRELAITAAAVLDAALVQLLHMRLADRGKESEDFLGLSGDSRAPCGSFGARIQLAYLVGLLTKDDIVVLRFIKNIRNAFAHRVKADFNTQHVLPLIRGLNDQFRAQSNRLIASGALKGQLHLKDSLKAHFASTPEAGAGLLLAVFTTYHAYLHRLSTEVCGIEDCIKRNK